MGGLVGRGQQLAPQRGDIDPDVVIRRDVVEVERPSSVSMPMVAFGSYGLSTCEGSQAAW